MQTNELSAAKAKLESDITSAVRELINEFESRSGIGVRAIEFPTLEVTTMNSSSALFLFQSASVELSL